MRRRLALAIALAAATPTLAAAADASWVFRPSEFSHDRATERRVVQFAAKVPAYAPNDPTYHESGYRHNRSVLRGPGGSADRLHIVQTWGAGEAIRPYGEWLFPYRAGATPYGPWGNPGGPWTMPFGSWQNPYGLGRLPHPPWPHWPYYSPYGNPPGYRGPLGP
jgi:hypothetical protein